MSVLWLLRALSVVTLGAMVLGPIEPSPAQAGRAPVRATSTRITLLTWNIQGGRADSDVVSSDPADTTIVSYIKATGAEFVALQEVSAQQAEMIAAGLGWGVDPAHLRTAFENLGAEEYAEGIAMLSRFPMTDYASIPLLPAEIRDDPDGRGRKLQAATIVKNGTVYHVYNTHLASDDWTCCTDMPAHGVHGGGSDLNNTNRGHQAEFIRNTINRREMLAKDDAAIYVLAGDMNSHPWPGGTNSLAYEVLAAAYTDSWLFFHPSANHPSATAGRPCTDGSGCTFPARDATKVATVPTRRIDDLFVGLGRRSHIRSASTPPPMPQPAYARLSDHFPYQVTIDTDSR